MTGVRTVPTHQTGLPVRAVKVEVTDGIDAGKAYVAESDTLTVGTAPGNDLVLGDPKVSRYHLELRPAADRIAVADRGSTNGTRIGPVVVRDAQVTVDAGTTLSIGDSTLVLADGGVVMLPVSGHKRVGGIVGNAPNMRQLMAKVEKLATNDASVLILGESGTGKELIARAIHDLGPRSDQPFVTVDCGALTSSLIGSELFGHERGAFTGAEQARAGAFERAHGGTLFLDELGELPEDTQAALLGALERRSFRRIGGTSEISVDLRLIGATNRDLRSRVNAGSFRLDLYYRVAVVLLEVPPLRERASDLPALVEHVLREHGYGGSVSDVFDEASLARMRRHPWLGNVRELRNAVIGALATGEQPQLDGLRPPGTGDDATDIIEAVLELPYKRARRAVLDAFEPRYLAALLERAGGSVRAAAREAQMDRSYLTELIKRHGIL